MGVSNRPAEPGRSDARANRRRVLEAARSALREQGPDAEVREIAQRAGVGLATIYRGFGNKEGLLAAVAEQVKNDVLDLFSAAEMQAQPAEGLRRFLVDAIGYVEAHGPLFDILAGHSWGEGREVHLRAAQEHHLEFSARLRSLIERGIAAGDLRADLNVDVVEHLIFSSLVSIAHSRELTPRVGAQEFARSMLSLLTAPREPT